MQIRSDFPGGNVQLRFADALSRITLTETADAIRYHAVTVPYTGNTTSAKCFFRNQRASDLSVTPETPYSGNLSHPYTPELLRLWATTSHRHFWKPCAIVINSSVP